MERAPRLLTLRDAAAWLTEAGAPTSYEAMRSMADRQQFPVVMRRSRRHVEMRVLRGLAAARRAEPPQASVGAGDAAVGPQVAAALDVVERLAERLAAESAARAAAEARLTLTERSESSALAELIELRTRNAALEAQLAQRRRRWWSRTAKSGDLV